MIDPPLTGAFNRPTACAEGKEGLLRRSVVARRRGWPIAPYACCGASAGVGDAWGTGGATGVSAIGSPRGELAGPSDGFGRDASDLFGGVLQDVLLVIVQVGRDDGLGEFASADPGPRALSQLLALKPEH